MIVSLRLCCMCEFDDEMKEEKEDNTQGNEDRDNDFGCGRYLHPPKQGKFSFKPPRGSVLEGTNGSM